MIRSYKTRIEALKQSTLTYYINKAMLASGTAIGFSLRRLSWAEIGFLVLLVRMLLSTMSPYFKPVRQALTKAIIEKWLTWKHNRVVTVRAAALATVTGILRQNSGVVRQMVVVPPAEGCFFGNDPC